MQKITVIRIGHRTKRDKRITTHCCLVARAFGAKKTMLFGEQEKNIEKTIAKINKKWGKGSTAKFEKNPIKKIKELKKKGYCIIHLTMYGIPLQKKIKKIRKIQKIGVVIGAEKVPRQIYEIADYNIAIGNQPHSEVAALAVFLHEYWKGKQLEKRFPKPKIKIIPQEKGKKVQKIKQKSK